MASSIEVQKIKANQKVSTFYFRPGTTDATDVSWVDMRDYDSLLCGYYRTSGTGALDTFAIIANDESDGSGTDVTVKTSTAAPDADGDQAWIEVTAQEVTEQGNASSINARYVSLSLEHATGTDEGAVVYVLSRAHHPKADLTADSIS